ncbi:MAG: hypothetical protein PHG79_02870 [Methanosarcina sp.]|nr:hypothetical protein [Methanosarcina sp.]
MNLEPRRRERSHRDENAGRIFPEFTQKLDEIDQLYVERLSN